MGFAIAKVMSVIQHSCATSTRTLERKGPDEERKPMERDVECADSFV